MYVWIVLEHNDFCSTKSQNTKPIQVFRSRSKAQELARQLAKKSRTDCDSGKSGCCCEYLHYRVLRKKLTE